ncbi:antitrypsin isoform X2 [Dendroctonus ponderosae]|uniref:antitrypsin isoform X2 n=1 Tax=Dendroctonus ponderosae TaxID=77166 RepID=UPI0020355B76|nr:antitrypsin isoform X2 [Dendroctonus ponderosae]
MKTVLVLLIALVATASCNLALDKFAEGNHKFTARLYNEILKANIGKNFVFSPFSVEVILALTRAGAKGKTASEFSTGVDLPSEEVTEEALKLFLPLLKSSNENLRLTTANKLYINSNFSILDSYKKLAVSTYDAATENVDFTKTTETANRINQWVEERTNNKIQNLVKPESLDDVQLVLINALHFKGKWSNPFVPSVTKSDFYVSATERTTVDMMFTEDTFKYAESADLDAKFIELPYEGGNVSMTVVLPNKVEGLAALERNLQAVFQPQNYQELYVSVKLPTFLTETELNLTPLLKNLGLATIFSESADLSGIASEPLMVSEVLQKAFINVTTTGTEAAATTASTFSFRSALHFVDPEALFVADRPFVYLITRKSVVLFIGKCQF